MFLTGLRASLRYLILQKTLALMPQYSFESVPFAANQVTSNEPLVLGKPACFAFVRVIFLHIY